MALNPQAFANLQAMINAQQNAPKSLVSFRAGLMDQRGTTIVADKRRGRINLTVEDGLLRFQWLTRPADTIELNLMLFKDNAVFEKVNGAPAGARVFLLKFNDSQSKRFFWIQEPTADNDAQYCQQINALIHNPPADNTSGLAALNATQDELGARGDAPLEQSAFAELLRISQNVVSQQPTSQSTPTAPQTSTVPAASPWPAASPSTSSSAATTSSTSSTPVQAAATPPVSSEAAAALARQLGALFTAAQQRQDELAAHNLLDILDADRVINALSTTNAQELSSLTQYLPDSQRDPSLIPTHLRSPQLRSMLSRLNSILSSQSYSALMQSLSLPLSASGEHGVLAFCQAIQKQVDQEKQTEQQDKPK